MDGCVCGFLLHAPLQPISTDVLSPTRCSLCTYQPISSLAGKDLSDGSNMWPSEQSPGNGVFGKGPQTALNLSSAGWAQNLPTAGWAQNLCSAGWTSLVVGPGPEYLLQKAFATLFAIAFLKSYSPQTMYHYP